jgi:hypothetical protein
MRKILYSILLLFFRLPIYTQKTCAEERIVTTPDHKSSNAFTSASVLKMNVLVWALRYPEFAFDKSADHLGSMESDLAIIGAATVLNIEQSSPWTLERLGCKYRAGHENQFAGFFPVVHKFYSKINYLLLCYEI